MAMTLITTNTESSDTTSDFTSSIDSTYKLYVFKFININPETNNAYFQFQVNASGQSDYNETMTTTAFWASHNEGDSAAEVIYDNTTTYDQGQGTGFQPLTHSIQSDADGSMSGELHLFNPSSTTYVKHFYSTTNTMGSGYSINFFSGGFCNFTAALTNVQFKMSAGDFYGTIKLYGVG